MNVAVILAFVELAIKAFDRVKWLLERPNATFTDEEKAQINQELDEAHDRLKALVVDN